MGSCPNRDLPHRSNKADKPSPFALNQASLRVQQVKKLSSCKAGSSAINSSNSTVEKAPLAIISMGKSFRTFSTSMPTARLFAMTI